MTRHFRCAATYTRLALVRKRDQYPNGIDVLSGSWCNETHTPRTFQGSLASVICLSANRAANTGGETSFCCVLSIASSTFSHNTKLTGGDSCSLLFNKKNILVNCGTSRLMTLHKSQNSFNLVKCGGTFSLFMTSIVRNPIFKSLGLIVRLTKALLSVKTIKFIN